MKNILLVVLFVLILCSSVFADVIQLDDVFTKTNHWLDQQNLSITGSPSGRDDLAAFAQDEILFYGEAVGNPAHISPNLREMMAKTAAEVRAKKAVVEYLEGFALVGDTYIKDCMTQNEVVRISVAGFVKNVQVVASEYNKEKDTAVAVVKIGLHGPRGFASSIYEKMMSEPKMKKSISTNNPPFSGKSVDLGDTYDGLIIDTNDQNFRPALINRIFTEKGEVLYDPAKIEKKLLVEQGCGEYASTVEKARNALSKRGVINPLIISATSSASAADLKVSNDDAVKIFSADLKSKFLKDARVAFVLK